MAVRIAGNEGVWPGLVGLRLLQSPAMLLTDGGERPLSANDAALLLLLVRRQTLDRAWIAARLWPQVSLDAAKNSLRQRLFRLDKSAGRALLRKDEPGDRLALAAGIAHDLGDPYPLLTCDPTASDATLLKGLSFSGQQALDDEIQSERLAWGSAFVEALSRLAAEREADGRVAEALAFARRLAIAEPFSEHAARLLMRLHDRRGDRSAALNAFDALKQRLFDQLGEAPDEETIALSQQIAHRSEPAARALPALPIALRHPPYTVGRDALLGMAERRLKQGRAVLLVGPAGIGKTRVFEELVARQSQPVVCQVMPDDGTVGWSLAGRLAAALMPRWPAIGEGDAQAVMSWLAAPRRCAAPGAISIERLFDVFEACLLAVREPQSVCIAIEDLHFADSDSCCLLARLLRVGGSWLMTSRDHELPTPLAQWLDDQPDSDEAEFMLQPLALEGVAELVSSVHPMAEADTRWAEALAAHCGGHPLSVLQVLRSLHDRGGLRGAAPPAVLPIPHDAMQRVARQLDRCDSRAQQLAFVAALCGADFSDDIARRLLRCSASELAVPWRQLQAIGLLRGDCFTHELVRQAVLDAVPDALRPAMHREIAQALADGGVPPVRRVRHWLAASEWAAAAKDQAQAADDALAAGLRLKAHVLLLGAAESLERCGDLSGGFECRARAIPLTLSLVSARQAHDEAAALLAAATGERQHCLAGLLMAQVLTEQHDGAGLAHAEQARLAAARLDDEALLARSTLAMAAALRGAGHTAAALERLDSVVALVPAMDAATRNEFTDTRALLLADLGRRREAVSVWRDELPSARASHDVARVSDLLSNAAIQLGYLCESEAGLVLSEEAMALDRRVGAERGFAAVNDLSVAAMCHDIGRFDRAVAVGEACVAALRQSGLEHFLVSAENCLAGTYLQLGRSDLAQRLLVDAPADAPTWARAIRRAAQGGLLRHRGESALVAMQDALALLRADKTLSAPYVDWRLALEVARCSDGAACVAGATACAAWADANEHLAMERQARFIAIEGLLKLQQAQAAAGRADALAAHFAGDWQANGFHLPELWWSLIRAWDANQQTERADELAVHAAAWIRQRAAAHVPEAFRASFLGRNRVNYAVLERAKSGWAPQ
jgi:DNA-binding SARP family transcriptional activator